MQEKEEQRAGRNKATLVDKGYISGGEYRKKFDSLSESKKLNRLLYNLAKKMLIHRSGTLYEDMYWIDPDKAEIIAEVTDSTEEGRIVYSSKVNEAISNMVGLVTIHSHPAGLPPSIADFNSNFARHYSFGVVTGHNGRVYFYGSNQYIDDNYFELKVALYKMKGYNEYEARTKAIEFCCEHFDIFYKEVESDV